MVKGCFNGFRLLYSQNPVFKNFTHFNHNIMPSNDDIVKRAEGMAVNHFLAVKICDRIIYIFSSELIYVSSLSSGLSFARLFFFFKPFNLTFAKMLIPASFCVTYFDEHNKNKENLLNAIFVSSLRSI